jgi:hypothetical protein
MALTTTVYHTSERLGLNPTRLLGEKRSWFVSGTVSAAESLSVKFDRGSAMFLERGNMRPTWKLNVYVRGQLRAFAEIRVCGRGRTSHPAPFNSLASCPTPLRPSRIPLPTSTRSTASG